MSANKLLRFIAGKSSDRHGRVIVMVFSSLVLLISMVVLSFANTPFIMIVAAGIFGLSLGMNTPTLTAWTVDLCSPENRGKAVASVYIALEAGIGSGAIFSAWVYANRTENFIYAFMLPALFAFIALVLLIVWRKQGKPVVSGVNFFEE